MCRPPTSLHFTPDRVRGRLHVIAINIALLRRANHPRNSPLVNGIRVDTPIFHSGY